MKFNLIYINLENKFDNVYPKSIRVFRIFHIQVIEFSIFTQSLKPLIFQILARKFHFDVFTDSTNFIELQNFLELAKKIFVLWITVKSFEFIPHYCAEQFDQVR